jgi:hypothetical protein
MSRGLGTLIKDNGTRPVEDDILVDYDLLDPVLKEYRITSSMAFSRMERRPRAPVFLQLAGNGNQRAVGEFEVHLPSKSRWYCLIRHFGSGESGSAILVQLVEGRQHEAAAR